MNHICHQEYKSMTAKAKKNASLVKDTPHAGGELGGHVFPSIFAYAVILRACNLQHESYSRQRKIEAVTYHWLTHKLLKYLL